MTDPCPFARLGLAPDADADAVQAAWRRLARRHHPDLHPQDPDATARFQALSAARDAVLARLAAQAPAQTPAPAEPFPGDDLPPAPPVPGWRARAAEPRGWRARAVPIPPWRSA